MVSTTEYCDACGFDGSEWNRLDTVNTVRNLAVLPEIWIGSVGHDFANTRTAPDRWSIAEYVDHLREVVFGMRMLTEVALDEPGRDLGPEIGAPAAGEARTVELGPALDGLATEAAAFHGRLLSIDEADWDRSVLLGGVSHSIGWAAHHAVHDTMHHLRDLAAIRDELDPASAAAVGSGSVAALAMSDGGVPKTTVERAQVGRRGLLGDRQHARQHHGRPWQALCLWSADVIDELASLGNPIAPGNAGENITIGRLDWAALRGGHVLRIGGVVCQLSAQAIPCAKNNRWFADGNAQQIHHERRPAWTRWYASVLEPGEIVVGDAVTVEAATPPG